MSRGIQSLSNITRMEPCSTRIVSGIDSAQMDTAPRVSPSGVWTPRKEWMEDDFTVLKYPSSPKGYCDIPFDINWCSVTRISLPTNKNDPACYLSSIELKSTLDLQVFNHVTSTSNVVGKGHGSTVELLDHPLTRTSSIVRGKCGSNVELSTTRSLQANRCVLRCHVHDGHLDSGSRP